jgi:hypothetical protein
MTVLDEAYIQPRIFDEKESPTSLFAEATRDSLFKPRVNAKRDRRQQVFINLKATFHPSLRRDHGTRKGSRADLKDAFERPS